MRISGSIFFILTTLAGALPANAQSFSMQPPPEDPVVEPQIIGGRLARRANWPATFIFKDPEIPRPNKEVCTSTAVGKRVILTAAHCVRNGAKGEIGSGGQNLSITCSHHPDYTPQGTHATLTTSADWALCLAAGDIKVVEYETINRNSAAIKKAQELLLTGFGCNKVGGTDGGFGQLFEGEASVTDLPSKNDPERWKINYITTSGGAAVCFGDSGGATYLFLDAAKRSRALVGVNSRGDIEKVSYISSSSTDSFLSWARNWASTNGVLICGLHDDAPSCHP
jgi:hypothetical protein